MLSSGPVIICYLFVLHLDYREFGSKAIFPSAAWCLAMLWDVILGIPIIKGFFILCNTENQQHVTLGSPTDETGQKVHRPSNRQRIVPRGCLSAAGLCLKYTHQV